MSLLLQALCSIWSERQLMEQLDCNLLRVRKRVEEVLCWIKGSAGLRQTSITAASESLGDGRRGELKPRIPPSFPSAEPMFGCASPAAVNLASAHLDQAAILADALA